MNRDRDIQNETECQSGAPPMDKLRHMARRYSRRSEEADDLVQDVLLEAVRTKRDIAAPEFIRWATGVIRNRAAFIARSEGRRRRREAVYAENPPAGSAHARIRFPEAFIKDLRPSLRMVALLLNCGMNRREISYLAAITDTALRRRLTELRRAWHAHIDSGGEEPEHIEETDTVFPDGLMRRTLRNSIVSSSNRSFGSHDPDGHLFICSQNGELRQPDKNESSQDQKK